MNSILFNADDTETAAERTRMFFCELFQRSLADVSATSALNFVFLFTVQLCFAVTSVTAQSNLQKFYSNFYTALITDSSSLSSYVHPNELKLSKRLGIQYEGVKNKFTISFDFDDEVKRGVRDGSLNAVVKIDSLEDGNVKLGVEIPTKRLKKYFYFDHEKLVSPVYHFARNWKRWETKHFQFWISDTSQFHPEAMNQLEEFLQRSAALLQISKTDLQLLTRENLFANNSIAGSASPFSLPPKAVPSVNGVYRFFVRRDVFPVPIMRADVAVDFAQARR